MTEYFTKNEKAAIKEFHTEHYVVSVALWNLLRHQFFLKDFASLSYKYLEKEILFTVEMTLLLSSIDIDTDEEFIDAQDIRVFITNLVKEIKSLILS